MPGFRRRRPIARAAAGAATAGIAYNAGKRKATKEAGDQAAPEPEAAADDDVTVQIEKLAELHAKGVLTDDEFAAAKAKALGI